MVQYHYFDLGPVEALGWVTSHLFLPTRPPLELMSALSQNFSNEISAGGLGLRVLLVSYDGMSEPTNIVASRCLIMTAPCDQHTVIHQLSRQPPVMYKYYSLTIRLLSIDN